jgi:SAM-dependent methyltransferase
MSMDLPETPDSEKLQPSPYDVLASEYDRFMDWPTRLIHELPFLLQALRKNGGRRVLDAACGTGIHAIALAGEGFSVTGVDSSSGMVEQARENAVQAGAAEAQFEQAGFGELAPMFGVGKFDAVLCLGSSLPHAADREGVLLTLKDFAACLRPDGLLIIQNRNFDAILSRRDKWMPLQAWSGGSLERIFLRSYDFEPDGSLTFWVILLSRNAGGAWRMQLGSSRLYPLPRESLLAVLTEAGFGVCRDWGDSKGSGFDPSHSPDLWVSAAKKSCIGRERSE